MDGVGAFQYGDYFLFDGSSWRDITQFPCPQPRNGPGLCYDSNRSRLVIFGGTEGSAVSLDDTWELGSGKWIPGPPAPPGMAGRAYHAMWFDPSRGSVLYGGHDDVGNYFSDAWSYDGTGWTAMPAVPPALGARAGAAAVFDAARGRAVVYGGVRSSGAVLSDTWELGPGGWTQGPNGLAPRLWHCMAYDASRSRTILFGGTDGTTDSHQTWEYDGTAWTMGASAPPLLTPREGASMAYDSRSRRIVLFGGYEQATDTYLDDTWELTPYQDIVAGSGLAQSNPNEVRVFSSSACGNATVDFFAYGAAQWGTNVAAGNVDSGQDEILTAPGPGPVYGPQVRAFARTGTAIPKVNFYAYGTLKYGANVTAGDVDGDRIAEIVTGPGPGGVFGRLQRYEAKPAGAERSTEPRTCAASTTTVRASRR